MLESFGEPEVLQVKDVPEPTPGPDEVIVAVSASALNRADLLQRRGFYPGPKLVYGGQTFDIPGMELSGTVVDRGDRVSEWAIGDAAMAIVSGGGYAEKVAVHERQLLPVPFSVSTRDAAAIPEVFITAWDALVVQGGLTSGRVALVHAGASGVGTAAIQIVKAIGATIVVTDVDGKGRGLPSARCRPRRRLHQRGLRGRGPRVHRRTRRRRRARRHRGRVPRAQPRRARRRRARSCRSARWAAATRRSRSARCSTSGLASIGTVLRARPLEEKAAISRQFGREMLPLFDQGLLKPVIDRHFSIDEVVDAHRYMESNANVGKIVLDVGLMLLARDRCLG